MKPLRFAPLALEELRAAAAWIDNERSGHGRLFCQRVRECAQRLAHFPHLGRPIPGTDARCRLLEQFPYQLIYSVEADTIEIIAIAHSARKPGYWHERE